MKRMCSKILLVTFLCSLLTLLICFLTIKFDTIDYQGFELSKKVLEDVNKSDGAPGSGEYLLIAGTLSFSADIIGILGLAIFYGFILFLIPLALIGLVLLFDLIARLVQLGEPKSSKNTASIVLLIIAIVIHFVLILEFIVSLSIGFKILHIVFPIINILINLACIIYSIYMIHSFKKENQIDVQKKEIVIENNNI